MPIKRIEYNPSYEPFLLSEKRYTVLIGGAGSGKSHATIQKILYRICSEDKHRILCVRKTAESLRKSVYQGLVDTIIDYELSSNFTINKSEMKFTHSNGNEILLSGMDDPEKIKSIAGITSVWCEEATELEEIDFNQLELRVRGETVNYKQFMLTFNPINEEHWLKKRFFDKHDDDVFILKTTFKDNLFLDEQYIKHLTERVVSNENLYRIYVLGEWGKDLTGMEFYSKFNRSKIVTKREMYIPDLPLWISWDENVNPYLPAIVFQVKDKQINVLSEITAKHPNNTITGACKVFTDKYFSHISGVIITGDSTSKKQDVKIEKGFDFFRLVENELIQYHPKRQVPTVNPSVYMRGLFMNAIFDNNFDGIQINIHESCNNLINDLLYTKQNPDGTKYKEMAKDDFGIRSQKYGHLSDCLDYALCVTNKYSYESFQRGGVKQKPTIGLKMWRKESGY